MGRNYSNKDWRDIAEQAMQETDPSRLNRLFYQLNEALESQSGPVAKVELGPGVSLMYASPSPFANSNWHNLYIAALFEEDRARIPGLIAQAETVLVARERELFSSESALHAKDNEKEAVNSALDALRVLRTCLGLSKGKSAMAA